MAEIDRNKGLKPGSAHLVDVRDLPPALPDELTVRRQKKAKVAAIDLETPLEIGGFQTGGVNLEQRTKDEADLVAGTSILTLYLNEMGRISMIDQATERALAERVASGITAATQIEAPGNSEQKIEELEDAIFQGKEAHRRLIEVNLRLVVSEAKKYLGRGLPLLDLIQEGNLGLHRAIELFDLKKKNRLSTYAVPWIRNFLAAATAEKSRVISITRTEVGVLGRIHEAVRTLELMFGREPSIEEIAEMVEMKPVAVLDILGRTTPAMSLSTPMGEDGETLADLVSNQSATQAESKMISDEKVYAELRERLSDDELFVIQMRYLVYDSEWRPTLRDLADSMNIPVSRVDRLEKTALGKLRDKQVAQVLRGF